VGARERDKTPDGGKKERQNTGRRQDRETKHRMEVRERERQDEGKRETRRRQERDKTETKHRMETREKDKL